MTLSFVVLSTGLDTFKELRNALATDSRARLLAGGNDAEQLYAEIVNLRPNAAVITLSDAARRGARYAVNHATGDAAAVKNVVVYGVPEGGGKPVVDNLTTANVQVQYTNFGLGAGTASVSITGYQFQFIIPVVGTTINMPNYNTTLTGENAGLVPPDM